MDGHEFLGDVVLASTLGDGGPRRCRQRGRPLPEKYMPGCYFARLLPEYRAAITRAVNSGAVPAPWFLRWVIADEDEARLVLPPPPSDRRWSSRGRWAAPLASAARRVGGAAAR